MTISARGIIFLHPDCHRVDSLPVFLCSSIGARFNSATVRVENGLTNNLVMKDLNGLSHSFQGWGALLDFLSNVKQPKDINDIHVTREGDKEWVMKISGTDRNGQRKPKAPAAGLYDLYW